MAGETKIKNGLIVDGDSQLENITEIISTNSSYKIGSPVLFDRGYNTSSFRKESFFLGISTVLKIGGPTANIKILRSGSILVNNDDFPYVTQNGTLYINEEGTSLTGLSTTYIEGLSIGSVGGYVAGSGNQFTINITGSSSISSKILNSRDWQDNVLLVIGNGEIYTEGGIKPLLPSSGDIYVNTLSKSIEIYDGALWNMISSPINGDRILVMTSPGAGTYFPTSDSIYIVYYNNWTDYNYNYKVNNYTNIYSKYDDIIWTGKGISGSMTWIKTYDGNLVTAGGGDQSLVNSTTNAVKELTAGTNISITDNGNDITINTDAEKIYDYVVKSDGTDLENWNDLVEGLTNSAYKSVFVSNGTYIVPLNWTPIIVNGSAITISVNKEIIGSQRDSVIITGSNVDDADNITTILYGTGNCSVSNITVTSLSLNKATSINLVKNLTLNNVRLTFCTNLGLGLGFGANTITNSSNVSISSCDGAINGGSYLTAIFAHGQIYDCHHIDNIEILGKANSFFFNNCSYVTNIKVISSVALAKGFIFIHDFSNIEIDITGDMTSDIFSNNCYNLSNINFTNCELDATKYVFKDCDNIDNIKVTATSTTTLGFLNCNHLKNITLENFLGKETENCSNFSNLKITNSDGAVNAISTEGYTLDKTNANRGEVLFLKSDAADSNLVTDNGTGLFVGLSIDNAVVGEVSQVISKGKIYDLLMADFPLVTDNGNLYVQGSLLTDSNLAYNDNFIEIGTVFDYSGSTFSIRIDVSSAKYSNTLGYINDVTATNHTAGALLTGNGTSFTTSNFQIDDTANAATDILWSSNRVETAITDEIKALDWKDSAVFFFDSYEKVYSEQIADPGGSDGDMWVNTSDNSVRVHNGASWDIVSIPTLGDRLVIPGNTGALTFFPNDDTIATYDGTNWTNDQAIVNDGVTVFNEYDKIVYRGKGDASPLTWAKVFSGIGSASSSDNSLDVTLVNGVSLDVKTLSELLILDPGENKTSAIGGTWAVRFDYLLNYDSYTSDQTFKTGSIIATRLGGVLVQSHTSTIDVGPRSTSNAIVEAVISGSGIKLKVTTDEYTYLHVRAYPIDIP